MLLSELIRYLIKPFLSVGKKYQSDQNYSQHVIEKIGRPG